MILNRSLNVFTLVSAASILPAQRLNNTLPLHSSPKQMALGIYLPPPCGKEINLFGKGLVQSNFSHNLKTFSPFLIIALSLGRSFCVDLVTGASCTWWEVRRKTRFSSYTVILYQNEAIAYKNQKLSVLGKLLNLTDSARN